MIAGTVAGTVYSGWKRERLVTPTGLEPVFQP